MKFSQHIVYSIQLHGSDSDWFGSQLRMSAYSYGRCMGEVYGGMLFLMNSIAVLTFKMHSWIFLNFLNFYTPSHSGREWSSWRSQNKRLTFQLSHTWDWKSKLWHTKILLINHNQMPEEIWCHHTSQTIKVAVTIFIPIITIRSILKKNPV